MKSAVTELPVQHARVRAVVLVGGSLVASACGGLTSSPLLYDASSMDVVTSRDARGTQDEQSGEASSRDVGTRDGEEGDDGRLEAGVCLASESCSAGDVCAVSKSNPCAPVDCVAGCCVSVNAPAGTPCPAGNVCDGKGQCVACLTPSNCAPTGTTCEVLTCEVNVCGQIPASEGTQCTENGGRICNGSGNCVTCTPNDTSECPPSAPKCSAAGHCVSCLSDGDCGDGNTPHCNAAGQCVQCVTNANCGLQTCNNGQCGGL